MNLTNELIKNSDSRIISFDSKNENNVQKINFNSFLLEKLSQQLGIISSIIDFSVVFWILKTIKFLKRNINEFDCLHISCSPILTNLIGYYFSFFYSKKWIVHLYDPLVDNSFINKNSINKFFLKKIESLYIKKSDIVITVNKKQFNILAERYVDNKNKLYMLNQTFSSIATKKQNVKINNYNEILILHAGRIYGDRNLDLIISSLKQITSNKNNFKFLIIGSEINTSFIPSSLKSYFEFVPRLSKSDLRIFYDKCDYLLLIDSMIDESVFLSSKIGEYLSLNKPIIALTLKNSATYIELKNTDSYLLTNEKNLINFLNTIEKPNKNLKYDSLKEKYKIKNVVRHYNNLIKNLK